MGDEFYLSVFDALPGHLAVLDEGGRIVATNRAWRAFAEANRGDPLRGGTGADYLEVCDRSEGEASEQAAEVACSLREMLAGSRATFSVEYPCHAPGKRRWFVCRAFLIPESESARVLVQHEDVTAARNAREAERLLGGQAHMLFECAPDATLVVDQSGHIVHANRQAEALFGYALTDLLGASLESLLPERARQRHVALRRGYQAAPERRNMGVRGTSLEALDQQGEEIPVEVSLAPFVTGEGAWTLAAVRDLRERRELESRLRQAEKLETIGQLAGGIAHDFNNLLTVIGGTASVLLETHGEDASLREDLATIAHACEEAALLTRMLLSFARKSPIQPETVSLAEFWHRLEPMLRRLVPEDIDLRVDILESNLFVRMDAIQLEQIFLNLIVNSRDAMPRAGSIHISMGGVDLHPDDPRCLPHMAQGRHVWLRFDDSGPGISEALMESIFEPFFTTKDLGTGLGLATVQGIVHDNRGNIWCESGQGRGASFVILLPRAAWQG